MSNRQSGIFSKSRLVILYIIISLSWLLLFLRLAEIQVVHGGEYGEKARKQSTGKISVKADRGLVFDRKGRQVAVNVIMNSLYAYPSSNQEIKNIYRYLDRLYNRTAGSSRWKYSLKTEKFSWIDRDLPDELAEKLVNDSIPGLYIKKQMKRDYPFGNIGRQLLGGTDIDDNGISGLEYSYDSLLAGQPGLIDYLRDAHRNTYRIKEIPLVQPIPGKSLVLTLDWYFQEIVEEELRAAVEKYHALEGTALFLDCHTGEILAAADYVAGDDDRAIKLRAVSNCFEPGSVFKAFTAGALLDNKLVDFEEKIYCEEGLWKLKRGRLHDDKKHDSLTFREIIELSSNIGIGKLALRLGPDKLVEMAHRFGFGQKYFVGLPGEQSGNVAAPRVWSDYNIAALSIGHSVSVTALQLTSAMGAIANGEKLYRPSIIRGIIDCNGRVVKKNGPQVVGKAINPKSAEILRTFLTGVVERGTATPVKSDIVSIAGKTGTAEVVDFKNGGYIKNKFVASFLGYFPADDPKIAGVVVLNQPEPIHYGGYTSGPAFKNMAERYSVANSDFLRPDTRLTAGDEEMDMKKVPDFVGRDISLVKQMAEKDGIPIAANAEHGVVIWQYPPEGRILPGNETVAVVVENEGAEDMVMMNLLGMKIRTAMAVLNYLGLPHEIEGYGFVRDQYPRAGKAVNKNIRCHLVCRKG
nr:PASTA domain-containing protein [candidate division Zixibacteria bacterium]